MPFFKTSDGLNLHYWDDGSGTPVLCLPGLTRSGHDFDEMAPHLPGIRLIRLDSRGRGRSDWDPEPLNYTVPIEARDALQLLDHLGLDKVGVIGTSRGGMLAMLIAAMAKNRLSGVLLNDVGPVLDKADLKVIVDSVGRNPPYKDYEDAEKRYPNDWPGFPGVPAERWQVEVRRLWQETPDGLAIRYDPGLKIATEAVFNGPEADLWPLFDALAGLPLALLRGANSRLLTPETVGEMRRRRPDMLFANVPDRAHIPFLDEAESLDIIRRWIGLLG
ncbi:MAG: alpha/beta hydrolase [Rhodobacteraceae bacterium]|nr:alpha/beta hydrolase [Paracoccaceae bacterium]